MAAFALDRQLARQLTENPGFLWHQRLELAAGITSPGVHEIERLLELVGLPRRLDGLSVLDIGTCNGGAAFIAEQRGASRVVGVDIYDPSWFGFDRLADALGSTAEFVQASVYELPAVLDEQFDIVLCLGVVYHLRHPLLAVDALHQLTGGRLYVETAISPETSTVGRAEFYPEQYRGDTYNWFIPSVRCLRDWFGTSGFAVERAEAMPGAPDRGLLVGTPTVPGFLSSSPEVALQVRTQPR